ATWLDWKCNPAVPGVIMEAVAPMLEASTGVPAAKASITVRGIPSYHSEGNTRNSACCISSKHSLADLGPRYWMARADSAVVFTNWLSGPSPTTFKGIVSCALFQASSNVFRPFSGLNLPTKRAYPPPPVPGAGEGCTKLG